MYDFEALKFAAGNVQNSEPIMKFLTDYKDTLMETPASQKYHLCWPGGLVDHTINVVNQIQDLHNLIDGDRHKIDIGSAIKVAILHDIGKMGTPGRKTYVWDEDRKAYGYQPQIMAHAELSIWWCNHAGIPLTLEEHQAIRYHNGLYVDDYKQILGQEQKLTHLLHFADMLACKFDEAQQ